MTDLFTSFFFFSLNHITKEHQSPMNSSLILKCDGKFSLTYSSEVSVGLQHHIFVETPLGRIQQSPFFTSEVNMHIIIGHWILKYSIHLYNRKHDFDNNANVYFFDSVVITLVLPVLSLWNKHNLITKSL